MYYILDFGVSPLSGDQSSHSMATILTVLVITSGYYSCGHVSFMVATTSPNIKLRYNNSREVFT